VNIEGVVLVVVIVDKNVRKTRSYLVTINSKLTDISEPVVYS